MKLLIPNTDDYDCFRCTFAEQFKRQSRWVPQASELVNGSLWLK